MSNSYRIRESAFLCFELSKKEAKEHLNDALSNNDYDKILSWIHFLRRINCPKDYPTLDTLIQKKEAIECLFLSTN
jgi:hypothetical protein